MYIYIYTASQQINIYIYIYITHTYIYIDGNLGQDQQMEATHGNRTDCTTTAGVLEMRKASARKRLVEKSF